MAQIKLITLLLLFEYCCGDHEDMSGRAERRTFPKVRRIGPGVWV